MKSNEGGENVDVKIVFDAGTASSRGRMRLSEAFAQIINRFLPGPSSQKHAILRICRDCVPNLKGRTGSAASLCVDT